MNSITDTVQVAIDNYLDHVVSRYKPNTIRNYTMVVNWFKEYLSKKGLDISSVSVSLISESWITGFIDEFQHLSESTQYNYAYPILGFYKYLQSNVNPAINMEGVRELVSSLGSSSSPKKRYKATDKSMGKFIGYVGQLTFQENIHVREKLSVLRDRSIILLLAETNIQVEELVNLNRSNVTWLADLASLSSDTWDEKTIELSKHLSQSLIEYLALRKSFDDTSNKSLNEIPLYLRHDKGAGKAILPISPTTVRNIVKKHAIDALGYSLGSSISPRDLSSYSSIITSIRKNLLALHPTIQKRCLVAFNAGLYDDAIFNAMKAVEDEVRKKTGLGMAYYGVGLIDEALRPKAPQIIFSSHKSEQESAFFLYKGAIGVFKNPLSHRYLDTSDPVRTFECLAFGSLLLKMLDETP